MAESIDHKCKYRDDSSGLWNRICTWWLLPLHIAFVAAFTIVLFAFDGHLVAIDGTIRYGRLSQSEVNIFISIGLTIIRLVAGGWLATLGWKMAFIVLEKRETNLAELDRLITWKMPLLARYQAERSSLRNKLKVRGGIKRNQETSSRHSYKQTTLLLWSICFMSIPPQIVAPLAFGSIIWIPHGERRPSNVQVPVTTPGPGDNWDWFGLYSRNRAFTVYQASALAFPVSSSSRANSSSPQNPRRSILTILGTAGNASLANVTVPLFSIHALEWLMNPDQLGDDEAIVHQAILNPHWGMLNISSPGNPFYIWNATGLGAITIINTQPWERGSSIATPGEPSNSTAHDAWPDPSIVSGPRIVAVMTDHNNVKKPEFLSCGERPSPIFGSTQVVTPWLFPAADQFTSPKSCYALARVNFTAGVATCKDCPIVSNGLVEADTSIQDQDFLNPRADPLVETSVSMMPEVMIFTSTTNSTFLPTWNNLEFYTRASLSVGYQASWNAVANGIRAESPLLTTTMSPIASVLSFGVNRPRLSLWAALQSLLIVSGIMLAFLQTGCDGKSVRNPVISAFLLDTRRLIERDTRGLCNASALKKGDGKIRLKLDVSRRNPDSNYRHPKLLVESDEDESELTEQRERLIRRIDDV
ncbi:hypothetical protein MMC18_009518 [Xylographa bjoerkii]|nr:hypothetical protein [Xylographa bjoerkii]